MAPTRVDGCRLLFLFGRSPSVDSGLLGVDPLASQDHGPLSLAAQFKEFYNNHLQQFAASGAAGSAAALAAAAAVGGGRNQDRYERYT